MPLLGVPGLGTWLQNGEPVSARGDNRGYTFTMLQDTVIAVATEAAHFDVLLQVEGPGDTENAVSVTVNGEATDPDDLGDIDGGSSVTFTAWPARGYLFDRWIVHGVDKGSDAVLSYASLATI